MKYTGKDSAGAGAGPGSLPGKRKSEAAAPTGGGGEGPDDDFKRFCRAWAWKREHRPDKDRFQRPYRHTLVLAHQDREPTSEHEQGGQQQQQQQQQETCTLVIKQSKFNAEGFASTVWDSAIVLSKWAERWAPLLAGKRCLDLSAGCGLVGIVLAKLGAEVVATDLSPNLPLLCDNCQANAPGAVTVLEHRWGDDVAPLGPPFDFVFGCDLMYIDEAVPDLITTLRALASWPRRRPTPSSPRGQAAEPPAAERTAAAAGPPQAATGAADRPAGGAASPSTAAGASAPAAADAASGRSDGGGAWSYGTRILISHGRNRVAEACFLEACRGVFDVERLPGGELDPVYQCSDVDVLRLTLAGPKPP